MARTRYAFFIFFIALFVSAGYVGATRYFGDGSVVVAENLSPTSSPEAILDPNILLPDLVPLPPQDMKVEKRDSGLFMMFSTTYYNQGLGTFELRADPRTAGIRDDIERDVLQRVYHKDGGHEDSLVGKFLWHQEHLHYHYADFITYDLTTVDAPPNEELDGILTKATFCLRDISRVFMPLENRVDEAGYKICGKELQGVSVGWGDTYYWDYPGQTLDISSLASGTYKLTFEVNPNRRLQETTFENNVASAVFRLDVEAGTVEVIEQTPKEIPEYEHVHLEDPFGM